MRKLGSLAPGRIWICDYVDRQPTNLGNGTGPPRFASGPVLTGLLLTSYADAAAARSAILASTNSRRKRCVRSTNVSLSARQVSNSRLTP